MKNKKNIFITLGVVVVLLAATLVFKGFSGGEAQNATLESDLIIPKNEINETAGFYPVKMGNTNMEIIAVKASDGTIRTAFNTCQVCNGSPRAYYKQEGDNLVCQNCGNRFSMDMIEQQRGGCNPIPIFEENKKDDGTNIVIAKDFIEQNKSIFTVNWKTK